MRPMVSAQVGHDSAPVGELVEPFVKDYWFGCSQQ